MPYEKCTNIEQENAIEKLKDRVKSKVTSPELLEDDAIFYKFLKAQNFDVDKAEKMLKKHIVWRKVHQVDKILEIFQPKEVYVKYVEPSLIGYDKNGDIVRFSAIGRLDFANYFKCMKSNDVIRHWIWHVEKNKKLANQTSKKISLCCIVDLDKLELVNSTSTLSVDCLVRFARTIQDNYAERLKAIYVINAPFYFVYLYKIISAILSHSMMKRLHVFGCDGWKKKLLEVIDADVLPMFLGGKRTDPDGDPFCKSFITIPGTIPDSYYLSENERYFEEPDKVSTLIIPPSEKEIISIHVPVAESSIHWKFLIRKKTIRFGLFLQGPQKEPQEVIPLYEYSTLDGTEENSYKCISPGNYIIIFDNSHSKFSSKEVQYVISVVKPKI